MSGEFEDSGILRLGIAGALTKEYAADERAFLAFLGKTLKSAFPESVELIYKGAFLVKKTLRALVVTIGEDRYTLEDVGHGPLKATSTHIVRGIALKTDKLDVPMWLTIVSEEVEAQALKHAESRKALQQMLGLP